MPKSLTFLPDASELLTSQQVIDRLLGDVTLRGVALTCVLPAVRSSPSLSRFRS